MPNKEPKKTRKQRIAEQGIHPSTRGDRGKSITAKLTEDCPRLYAEITDLRAKGLWKLQGDEKRTHVSVMRWRHNKNTRTVDLEELFHDLGIDDIDFDDIDFD